MSADWTKESFIRAVTCRHTKSRHTSTRTILTGSGLGSDAREEDERQRLEQQEPEELRPKLITARSGQEADAAWLEFTAWKHKPSSNMDDRG